MAKETSADSEVSSKVLISQAAFSSSVMNCLVQMMVLKYLLPKYSHFL